jgi:hypothetical protein
MAVIININASSEKVLVIDAEVLFHHSGEVTSVQQRGAGQDFQPENGRKEEGGTRVAEKREAGGGDGRISQHEGREVWE